MPTPGANMAEVKGPQVIRFIGPIVDALLKLGGSGTPDEVTDAIARDLGLAKEELNETLRSGGPRIRNRIRWARQYLVRAGLIDSSTRGVWSLTQKGRETRLDPETTSALFRDVQRQFATERKTQKTPRLPQEEATQS